MSCLSDMAAPTTGHRRTDHIRTMHLCEVAADFAISVLKPGGHFLAKTFQGGTENDAARPAEAQLPLRPPRQAAGLARRIGRALSAGQGFQGQGGGCDADESRSELRASERPLRPGDWLGAAFAHRCALRAGGRVAGDRAAGVGGEPQEGDGGERGDRRDDHEGRREGRQRRAARR